MASPPNSGDQNSLDYPKATLICRQNSHPFQERNLNLSQAVKIGRSVARDRVMSTNAIFECKVLSRNHALLWYENGKFFLQDTKSSNGTFVNNQRLSLGGMESQPHEVCSGDVVQFGVDVIENTRKVTHGCIVATLKLYLPDGTEAKASQVSCISHSQAFGAINAAELYQLNQYIQEATRREQQLEGKLGHLQRIVESTKSLAQQAWHCLLQEDLLLTRIDTLESQLQVFSNNAGDDKLRSEMVQLLDDKLKYQQAAKESLRHAVEDKLAAVQRCTVIETALCSAEEERDGTQRALARAQQDLQELAVQLISAQSELRDLRTQSERAERLRTEQQVLRAQLAECRHNESMCQTRYLCAQARLAVLNAAAKAMPINHIIKNAKSEGDFLDNENYQNNHEGLLSMIDLHIDLLQRRLMDLTSLKNGTTLEPGKKMSSTFSEEGNMTVIESENTMRLNQNNSDDTNNRNNTSDTTSALAMVGGETCDQVTVGGGGGGYTIPNYETTTHLDDSNVLDAANNEAVDASRHTNTVDQISVALLELRAQRELLVRPPNENETEKIYADETTNRATKESSNPSNDEDSVVEHKDQQTSVDWETENEKLRGQVESGRRKLEIYETEIVDLNHRLETLGIELQTRPSYNSLQEKETLCSQQKQTIDGLRNERDDLKRQVGESKLTELDLQSRVDSMTAKVVDLESTVADLQASLKDKEVHVNHLKEELLSQSVVERVQTTKSTDKTMSSVVQTEERGRAADRMAGTTQTPQQEYADFENSAQKDLEFLRDPDVELQEELVAIKEKYAVCARENGDLTERLGKLRADYDNALRQSRTMVFVYLAPLLAFVLYMLLSPYMNADQR